MGVRYDPEAEVTITCGTTEAIMSSILALCNPGEGVVYFEPTYENYMPTIQFAGGTRRPIEIDDDYEFDEESLRAAAKKSRLLVLNTPHNPSGKVFTRGELESIAEIVFEEDLIVVTDEIYEHIVYDEEYLSPIEVDGIAERTVVCTGISKTYSVTGWRVGFALAPEPLSRQLRRVHDYTSICAPTPFQRASLEALTLPTSYFEDLQRSYRERRDMLYDGLESIGLDPVEPDGAYYMMVHYPTDEDDTDFALRLIREAGVATVPGSSFYTDREADWIRFTFARNQDTIDRALEQLSENRWW